MKHQGMTLSEWIAYGRTCGAITDVLTVVWAYCMDEREALRWIAAIVEDGLGESVAVTHMKRDTPIYALPARTAASIIATPVPALEQPVLM